MVPEEGEEGGKGWYLRGGDRVGVGRVRKGREGGEEKGGRGREEKVRRGREGRDGERERGRRRRARAWRSIYGKGKVMVIAGSGGSWVWPSISEWAWRRRYRMLEVE